MGAAALILAGLGRAERGRGHDLLDAHAPTLTDAGALVIAPSIERLAAFFAAAPA